MLWHIQNKRRKWKKIVHFHSLSACLLPHMDSFPYQTPYRAPTHILIPPFVFSNKKSNKLKEFIQFLPRFSIVRCLCVWYNQNNEKNNKAYTFQLGERQPARIFSIVSNYSSGWKYDNFSPISPATLANRSSSKRKSDNFNCNVKVRGDASRFSIVCEYSDNDESHK